MMYNFKRPLGERYLRGEGPRRYRAAGGGGRWPSYEEGAADYNVYVSLTSITRLRVMSYLCVHGTARAPALARKLKVPVTSVREAMWGFKATQAAARKPCGMARGVSRSRTGGCWALEWEPTEIGRKWLWRFGWVTRRIWLATNWGWPGTGFRNRWDLAPYDVLRDYAEPTLLRPVPLAIMRYLVYNDPEQAEGIGERLGFRRSAVEQYMRKWLVLGWVTRLSGGNCPRSYWAPSCVESAPRWALTACGEEAVVRHVDALRWVSLTCGYMPDEDDDFLHDRDMVDYLPVSFYSAGSNHEG